MRAAVVRAFGGPDKIEILTLPEKAPGAGEARVKVAFAGVNAIDAHMREGDFLGSDSAMGRNRALTAALVLGYEGAGVVEAVGAGVVEVRPGDRVAWCGIPGAHAENVVVPAWRLVPVPEPMPLEIACALQLDGAMAHALSMSVFPVKAGDWLMLQDDGSVVGYLLAQIAKALGAKVIAMVPAEANAAAMTAVGAVPVVQGSLADVVARVIDATAGQGCNAVFDAIGQATIATSFACCRRRGLVALYAASSGVVEAIQPDQLAAGGSLFFTRVHLPDYLQDAREIRWRTGDIFTAWQSGALKLDAVRTLPLVAAREAHAALAKGRVGGKLVLDMAG